MSCRTVTIGTTATQICAENAGRKMIVITPPYNVDSFWSFAGDAAVTPTTGIRVLAESPSFSYDETEAGARKPVYAVVTSGTAVCRVEEIPY